MTTYQVKCPCGTVLTVSAEQASDAFVCPRCARKLAFTAPAQRTAAVAAPARAESGTARWYLARNKQRLGPYSSAQLKQFADAGQVQPDDMILREGRPKWVSAGSIKGLFTAARPAPPPAAIPIAEPQVVLEPFTDFAASPLERAVQRPRRSLGRFWLGVACAACVALVAVAFYFLLRKGSDQGPSGKQLDLTYVAADFNAVVVVHPRRMLERPSLAKLADEKVFAQAIDEMGLDPRKIEQLVVVVDPFPGGNVAAMPGFIARSTEPWEQTELVKRIRGGSEKVTFAGKEYLRTKNTSFAKTNDCLCLADEHTLLGGPEPTLKKMLEAKDARSPLRDRLPKVDLGHDIVAFFVMEQTERKDGSPTARQAFGEILQQAKDNPAFEGADKLADQIVAATFALDFGGDTLLSLDVETTDEAAATSVHGLADKGINLLKVFVPVGKQGLASSLPPDSAEPVSKLVDQLVKGISLAKTGNHVVLTLKMPDELPGLIEKLGPKLGEIGPQAPAQPIQRKGAPPGKGKTTGKGAKK
jgi:hypothetical protein